MICECEEDRASCGGWNPGLRIWGSDSFLSSANMGISPTFCLCCGAACPTCPTAVFENKHKLEVDGFSRGKKTEFSSARSTHLICAARFGPEICPSFDSVRVPGPFKNMLWKASTTVQVSLPGGVSPKIIIADLGCFLDLSVFTLK